MDVKKIPADVQSLISASAKVNNYRRAVEELVYNSLDAESTCIAIRINIGNNWMQVVDNGTGIKQADYKLLGERYATSKLFDINTLKEVPSKYGYQGQALSNIIEVSKSVKVTSRCADSNDTWVKTFVKGKIERECFKAPMRPSKGTTVEINGFLYNLNIHKKCINAFIEVQDIKTFLEQLLLIFNNVSISLRDDSVNEIIFKMHKNKDIYQTLKYLFDIDPKDFQELQVEKNEYKIKAFIGAEKKEIKHIRWIYLNNKFINASNLHNIINQTFTKPNDMKHLKVKTTRDYNEEKSVACDFVPFYFIFITCPYCEYYIVNTNKQTSIEFKNWVQINTIVGKLVKFYNGDNNLINVTKIDQKQVSPKSLDTRDEVKKIMQKFLGKPTKTAKISQMRNGVKGKRIRRKKKKQKLTLTKIIPLKNIPPQEKFNNYVNLYKNKFPKNVTNSNQLKSIETGSIRSNKQPMPERIIATKLRTNKKNHKISKTSLKCKCKKKYNNILEMFKNQRNSVKKRCNELYSEVKDYFNVRGCEKVKDICKSQPKYETSPMKTIYHDVLPTRPLSRNKGIIQMKSYDLLQTVISTQEGFYQQEVTKKHTTISQKLKVQRQTYSKSYRCAPILTFESHHYNNESAVIDKKIQSNVQFISNQSEENFNTGAVKLKRNTHTNRNSYTKRHGLLHAQSEQKPVMYEFNKLLNRYSKDGTEAPFSIDMTDSNTVEVSKQIRNQMMNDKNSLFDNEDCDKIYSPKSQLNFSNNLNIERTFTILVDSFYKSSQAQTIYVPTKRQTYIDETLNYNVLQSNTIHISRAYKTSSDMFKSESSHTSELVRIEPLDVCEAILNTLNNSKEDLNNTLNFTIQSEDLPLNVKEYQNSNNTLREKGMNKPQLDFSKTITLPPKNSATVTLKQSEKNKGTMKVVNELSDENTKYRNEKVNDVKIVPDNSIYNFKLNSRYRFVPKGMSQIFQNCYSKNICSYNLDTEYYENTIYNNFVEDVAINSEIYEPKVQNLKEYATENIQKATEKLKKHNADLIFRSESLRSAKVVLGQVDCKFIAAIIKAASETHKSPELLVCFDQHAVHERIRLEKILSYYVDDNNWKRVTIDTISLKCSKDEVLYLHNHRDKFIRFGLDWTILNNSEILVNAIPQAIRGKNPRPMEIIIKSVQDLILEQVYAIKHLKGNVSLYPQSIMKLVFSEACRYAIKFGDNLSRADCTKLVAELAECKTPFQCAHGRPVMAVMVELKNDQFEYKASMGKIMQFKNSSRK